MKVAVHLDGAEIRGNERQVILLAARLRERGHEVVASCRSGGPVAAEFARAGVRTAGIRPRGDLDPWHTLRFAAWLRRERPDALLLSSWKRMLVGGLAARAAGVPRVVMRVGGVHPVPPGAAGWKHRWALTHLVDATVANSREVAVRLRERVPGLSPGSVHLVPNGALLRPAPAAPLREELGLPAGALVALGVGGLDHRKGFDLLVGAAGALADRGLHLVIAGEGPQRAALLRQAESLGTADRLHLLGQRGDVPALLAAADLFVLSSRSEGMSVAMLEAMHAGRPVVAADVGGVWDALAARGGRPAAGWIVPPGDAAPLAAALAQVAASLRGGGGAVRARAAEAGWRLAHWFTVDRMVDGVEAVLEGRRVEEPAAEAG